MTMLDKLELTDISSITLDSANDTLSIKFDVKFGPAGETAEYEEEIAFNKDTPKALRDAASQLAAVALTAVRSRVSRQGEVKCTTCTGACCYKFSAVRLTPTDITMLRTQYGTHWVYEHVNFYAEVKEGLGDDLQTSWNGYIAEMKYVSAREATEVRNKAFYEWSATVGVDTQVCINLRADGCSIYETRPQVCRDFSSYTCGDTYEREDGKVRLRVL